MSDSSEPTVDISTRESELRSMSMKDLNKVHYKVTGESSVFLVSRDAIMNAVLKKEYPNQKRTATTTTTTTTSNVSAQEREEQLMGLDVSELRKLHYQGTNSDNKTLITKTTLINIIMKKEHPEYMAERKTGKRESVKQIPAKKLKQESKDMNSREQELNGLTEKVLRKLHFQMTKESSVKLVTKTSLVTAIMLKEYPDYVEPVHGPVPLPSRQSLSRYKRDDSKSSVKSAPLPKSGEERMVQLNEMQMKELRKLYFKLTKMSSLFFVSKESLMDAILQCEYPDYYGDKRKNKIKRHSTKGQATKGRERKNSTGRKTSSPGRRNSSPRKRSNSRPRKSSLKRNKGTKIRKSKSEDDLQLNEKELALRESRKAQVHGRNKIIRETRVRRYSLLKAFNQIDAQEERELQQQYEHYKKISHEYAKTHKIEGIIDYERVYSDITERVGVIVGTIASDLQKKPREGIHNNHVIAHLKILNDDDELNIDWIKDMLAEFRQNRILQYENAWQILKRVQPILFEEKNCVNADIADGEDAKFNIVGDLHGQLDDLLTILQLAGYPNEQNRILFNGDFVDRGQFSCEVVLTVFALKIAQRDYVFLNRGNHEASNLNAMYGFEKEVLEKYDNDLFELYTDVFACLPIATLINETVFVVHGGLSWNDFTIDELQDVDRYHRLVPLGLMKDLLWSDPEDIEGRQDSKRGAGLYFGEDVTEAFKEMNDVQLIIRSHEVVEDGYHIGHCITVFSASNYCGDTGNMGAYLHIDYPFKLRVATYMASSLVEQKEESGRNQALERSLISKLLVRIANHRQDLLAECARYANKDDEITKEEWAEVLNKVLGINVPFVRLAEQLGLGDFANKYVEVIKYKEFLDNFRPVAKGKAVQSQLGELLFQKRIELVSLFRYYDKEKKGTISIDEFKKGVTSLIKIAGDSISTTEVDRLAKEIDTINDLFYYEDYFNNYAPQDMNVMPDKKKIDMRRSKSIVMRQMALGVMMPDGLVEEVFGKGQRKVIPCSPRAGINTLVAEEMEESKKNHFIVMEEMRRKASIEAENREIQRHAEEVKTMEGDDDVFEEDEDDDDV